MADLDERFRSLDRVAAPDLWEDARTRTPRPQGPSPRGRLVAAGLALLVGGAGIAAAAISFLGGSTPPNPVGTAVTNGRIAYVLANDQTVDYDIYSVNPDGTDPVRLTDQPGWETDPVWSPDGSRIAFDFSRLIEGQPGEI